MKILDDLFSFKNKVIIITGGAGAIGSAAAELFSSLGANIVISDINAEKVKELAVTIQTKTGNEVLGLVADSTDENQMKELVEKTIAKFGKISGLINNVGWGAATPTFGSDTEKMVASYKLNTAGSVNSSGGLHFYEEKLRAASGKVADDATTVVVCRTNKYNGWFL